MLSVYPFSFNTRILCFQKGGKAMFTCAGKVGFILSWSRNKRTAVARQQKLLKVWNLCEAALGFKLCILQIINQPHIWEEELYIQQSQFGEGRWNWLGENLYSSHLNGSWPIERQTVGTIYTKEDEKSPPSPRHECQAGSTQVESSATGAEQWAAEQLSSWAVSS